MYKLFSFAPNGRIFLYNILQVGPVTGLFVYGFFKQAINRKQVGDKQGSNEKLLMASVFNFSANRDMYQLSPDTKIKNWHLRQVFLFVFFFGHKFGQLKKEYEKFI